MDVYIEELKSVLDRVEITRGNDAGIGYSEGISELVGLFRSYKSSRKGVYLCGNGGSAGIAQHMTDDCKFG